MTSACDPEMANGSRVNKSTHEPDIRALESAIRAELEELEDCARFSTAATGRNTRRAYDDAWRGFSKFCRDCGYSELPADPETVRRYVGYLAMESRDDGAPRYTVASIRQKLAGIRWHHLEQGYLDPTGHNGVVRVVTGLVRRRQERPERKRPLLLTDVLTVTSRMTYDEFPEGISAARDRAAIWLAWSAALRRTEVATLALGQVEWCPSDGVQLHFRQSEGGYGSQQVNKMAIPRGSNPETCVPCALRHWVALIAASKAPEPQQATMRLLYAHQDEVHICQGPPDPTLSEDGTPLPGLEPDQPLLRRTYRNRHTATIHDSGVTGDALYEMLMTRLTEAGFQAQHYGWNSLRAGLMAELRRRGVSTLPKQRVA